LNQSTTVQTDRQYSLFQKNNKNSNAQHKVLH
jgi:hypothetical protein